MDKRLIALQKWLETVLPENLEDLLPASADASFRRYFRAHAGSRTYIVMDAPPEQEPLDQFIAIDHALLTQGVHTPEIFDSSPQQGFLLLEDLGNRMYLPALHEHSASLYAEALNALIKIQLGTSDQPEVELPDYHGGLLGQEMDLYEHWYLGRHKQITLDDRQQCVWQNTKSLLIDCCQRQPRVWVHRDYHSRNLMICDRNSPGVIDFQDMVLGPISYDLASLFKDCYIRWPRSKQLQWLADYRVQAMQQIADLNFTLEQLIEWYDLTGLQRHLKVLGIFCRLNFRDHKPHYMGDLERVREYITEVLAIYPALNDFSLLFNQMEGNRNDRD